jgi:hypothetical protein
MKPKPGTKSEQRDVGLVADAPDPIEQKGAPVPALDFSGNDFWIETNGRIAHHSGPVMNPSSGLIRDYPREVEQFRE